MKNKLIIFDFDGVIVETEMTTFKFYQELLPQYDITLNDEDFHLKAGRKSIDFFKDVLKEKFDDALVEELIQKKRQAFLQDVKKYVEPVPGTFKLLEDCFNAGLTLAIGSQNEKDLIQKAVDFFNIRKYFSFITSLQDIKNKKPDPEVFLLVTKSLNISPSESVVIDDAPIGVEAANRGGFKSIGITTSFKKEDLIHANKVIHSMEELSISFLQNF